VDIEAFIREDRVPSHVIDDVHVSIFLGIRSALLSPSMDSRSRSASHIYSYIQRHLPDAIPDETGTLSMTYHIIRLYTDIIVFTSNGRNSERNCYIKYGILYIPVIHDIIFFSQCKKNSL
jgi:hypothetical protein